MTEPGSDELLRKYADLGAVGHGARRERLRATLEEARVRATSPAEDEPGEGHPDPDQAPPPEQDHPEFDPLPPA